MRTIIRVGAVVGGFWFVALFALQSAVALLVLAGILAAGVCAGLAVAKWLERGWYGRQLEAGLRAGAIASGAAGLSSLIALLAMGPHDVKTLTAKSHALGLNLGGVARTLGFAGHIGVDVLGVLLAVALGVGLAAATAQVFAWSKSAKAVRIVTQARLAAQATRQDDDRAPYSGGPSVTGQPVHAAVLLGQMATGAYAVAAPISQGNVGGYGEPLFPAATAMPRLTGDHAPPSTPAAAQPMTPPTPPRPIVATPVVAASLRASRAPDVGETDETLADLFPGPDDRPPARKTSRARPASADLTDAMREALAAWADDSENSDPEARAGKKSEFLNAASPAPKRGRKKNDTRDWLC